MEEKRLLFSLRQPNELAHSPFSPTELKESPANLIIREQMNKEAGDMSLPVHLLQVRSKLDLMPEGLLAQDTGIGTIRKENR
jgi:hypothetical protein